MNDEKIVEIVVKDVIDRPKSVIGHPMKREDYDDENLYSDYQNDLGDDKPKYNDPQMQRRQ